MKSGATTNNEKVKYSQASKRIRKAISSCQQPTWTKFTNNLKSFAWPECFWEGSTRSRKWSRRGRRDSRTTLLDRTSRPRANRSPRTKNRNHISNQLNQISLFSSVCQKDKKNNFHNAHFNQRRVEMLSQNHSSHPLVSREASCCLKWASPSRDEIGDRTKQNMRSSNQHTRSSQT